MNDIDTEPVTEKDIQENYRRIKGEMEALLDKELSRISTAHPDQGE